MQDIEIEDLARDIQALQDGELRFSELLRIYPNIPMVKILEAYNIVLTTGEK